MQKLLCSVGAALLAALMVLTPGIGGGAPQAADTMSFWGPIPAPNDSNSVTVTNPERPAWEYPFLLPYYIVEIPLRLTFAGVGAAYIYLDESPVLPFFKRLFGPRMVPYGFLANFRAGGLTGFGAGVSLYHNELFGQNNRFKLRTNYAVTNTQDYSVGMLIRDRQPTRFEWGVGYRLRPRARYFGIGPSALEENESFYTQETAWGGLSAHRVLVGDVSLEASAVYSSVGTRGPDDDGDTPLEAKFDSADRPFGYSYRSEGVTGSIGLEYDSTDDTGRPETGSVLSIKYSWFEGRDDNVKFSAVRINAETFIGLWHQERALALRVVSNTVTNESDDTAIPFQRLMTNDEPDLMRGFRDFRWRDESITVFTAEYRFPWWAYRQAGGIGLDMFLFTDVGQVASKAFETGDLQSSYGVGWRFATPRGFVGRLDIGWSEEEWVVRLGAEQMFQYAKGGLFNGRDKSVLR